MSARHLRNFSGRDRDRDGFVDNSHFYALASEGQGQPLFLRHWKGRRYSDNSRRWQPLSSIKNGDGFQVLVQGRQDRSELFRILDVNGSGRINRLNRWQPQQLALSKDWEKYFGDVIQVDGVLGEDKDSNADGFLDAGIDYRIATDDGFVTLLDTGGKVLTTKSSRHWDAVRAVGVKSGFQVLLRHQRGRKPIRFKLLDVNRNGIITQNSRWKTTARALFAGWDPRFKSAILDGSSGSGDVSAASVGEQPPVRQLIYKAVATDLSEVTYSLEPSGDASLDGLSIDASLGEVHLTTEELIALPERVYFRVVATDAAGNRNFLDVSVSLTIDTPVEGWHSADAAPASGDEAMLSMSSIDALATIQSTEAQLAVESSGGFLLEAAEQDGESEESGASSGESEDSNFVEDLVDLASDQDESSDSDSNLSVADNASESSTIITDDELPITLQLDPTSDTGPIARDGLTRDRTPRFSGVATPGSKIELYAGTTLLGASPVNTDGEWQLTLTDQTELPDGIFSIVAHELSPDGSERSRSDVLALIVDGRAPEFTSAASASATLTLSADAFPPTDGVLFVSNDGSDTNPGSLLAPFRTIQHAIDNAEAGDLISIRAGTYRERLRIENLNGREDAPITFENYQNEDVLLTGAEPITTDWEPHDDNIWKTNLNFDISQLYLDGQMLTAARWPNITKEWDRIDDSDRRNATPDSYWDIEGTRALALVDSELPDVYANYESQQRLADLDFSVDGAMLVPHKSFGLTHSGEIINHKAGESSFDIDPNFELWLRSPGQKALKNFNWTSGNDGSVETADLWPLKNGPVQGTKQFHYHLEGHLGFLDRPQEWHYDKESGDLYVWLPDDQDPNLSDLQARTWDRSTSYIADPDQHPDADYHLLLEIKDSSFLDFKGITLHTGFFELNEATNLNFDQMRFLYPTYDGRMLKDGQRPLYNNRIQPVSLKGRPELENVPDSNISFSNSEFANGISGLLRAAAPGLELKNSYLHNVRDRGALRVAAAPRMNVERNTFHTFGFGGGGKIGDSSVWRYNHIYAFHGDGDISGIQVPASSQEGSLVSYNWIHDAPGRNGIRFDGSPAGIRGTAHHNVSRQTRRGMRIKGDQHKIMNNTLVSNFSYDISASRGKFYGYLDSTPGCLEWECRYLPSKYGKDPNRRLGHFNSTIHNNAFDRMPDPFGVGSPNQAIGNSYVSDHGQESTQR